ncbi:MAG: GntR family transcriptional regulator [Limnochordales bacterium]|nr:GntR family transcriptional regulator [Limnochordales bacterium]
MTWEEKEEKEEKSGLPRYEQVKSELRRMIREGKFGPGDRMYSEHELMKLYGISNTTARRVLNDMAREGLLIRQRGRGSFVRQSPTSRGLVGLILPYSRLIETVAGEEQTDLYYGPVTQAFRSTMEEAGYSVVLRALASHGKPSLPEELLGTLRGLAFLAPPVALLPWLQQLARRVPIVVIGATFAVPDFPCVDTDNIGGAYQAVSYLLSLGHRRIAYIGGPDSASNSHDRELGYRMALQEAGIPPEDELVSVQPEDVRDEEFGAETTRQLMGLPPADRPTAIFAGGYYLAVGALAALKEAGLSVPADVSLVGFDDSSVSAYLSPPLTTVVQPLSRLGRTGGERLLRGLAGETDPLRIALATRLVIRESAGPAPSTP